MNNNGNFDNRNYIKNNIILDNSTDIVSELVIYLKKQVEIKDFQIAEKNRIIDEIYSSRTWKLVVFLNKQASKIFPPDSRRHHICRYFWRFCCHIYHRHFGVLHKINKSETDLYKIWIRKNELPIKPVYKEIDNFSVPLISIVTPVYMTPPNILQETINSVLLQDYPKWELCIVNGSPEIDEIVKILNRFSEKDTRIKIKTLESNLGIAGNTNAAIKMAEGEFIAFLDHDDLIAPFALSSIVEALQSYPQTDIFYSDEDKLNQEGTKRYNPFFKPAYSPDYLRSVNYICHFLVIRKSLGEQLGWLRCGFEGAQDFDLILRATENSRFITHIPKILYHWRAIHGSTALSADSKNYVSEAGIKAVSEHLHRIGIKGKVIPGPLPTSYKILYSRPEKPPLISIIIPNHDHTDDLKKCVYSIITRSTYNNYEILIMENNSNENALFLTYKELDRYENIRILKYNHPFNFSEINNFAVNSANGELLLFLNNDTEIITQDWMEQMLSFALRPDVGIVGAKLIYPDNTLQHGGVIIGIGGIAGHSYKGKPENDLGDFLRLGVPQNYSAVTAACLMIRKKLFIEAGGFDPLFQLAFGDIDFCLQIMQKGYRNVWTPFAELYHFESKTRGLDDTPEKKKRVDCEITTFKLKWHSFLDGGDPYYNPNLTLSSEDFTIEPDSQTPHPRSLPGGVFPELRSGFKNYEN